MGNADVAPRTQAGRSSRARRNYMTGEDEAVLKEFLRHYGEIEDDEGFEAWYLRRYKGGKSEDHYKQTLHVAQVWKRRYEEGYQKGFQADLEAGQLSSLSSERTLCLRDMLCRN